MAGTTPRFGLNFFGGDTPGTLDEDAAKFTSEDRLTIDSVLSALETHNHRIVTHIIDPDDIPTLELSNAGTLEGGTTYYYVVSFVNADGLETISGPEASIATPDVLPDPDSPQGETSDSAGALEPGLYYYAITGLRGTEESALSEPATVTIVDDEDTVTLTLPDLGDATSYQVWRQGEEDPGYTRIGTTSSGAFTDDGSVPAGLYGDPANEAPLTPTGADNYSITITLTGADLTTVDTSRGWRIYRSTESGNYSASSLVHEVIERTDDIDPEAPLLTAWLDDGDAPLTGSPSQRTSQLDVPAFTFEYLPALPDPVGYPENYPILDDAGLWVNKAGTWTALGGGGGGGSGETGPTGPTGPLGATGATGPSGTPGGSGGGGGSTPTLYDSGTAYVVGDQVYTSLGSYLALVDSTGIDPDMEDPYLLTTLGSSTVFAASPAAAHDRLSRRFQVDTACDVIGLSLVFSGDVDAGDEIHISSTDPATTFTSMDYATTIGGTGSHSEVTTMTGGLIHLDVATDYWLVLSGSAAQSTTYAIEAGYNTLAGVVSDTGDTRYSDGVVGAGTTATADTSKFGFTLLGDSVVHWAPLGRLSTFSYGSTGFSGFDYSSGGYYRIGSVVRYANGIWVSLSEAPITGEAPSLAGYPWVHLAWIVPAGGTTGDILTKISADDGDYGWAAP